jgi:protein-disulfide isomerase
MDNQPEDIRLTKRQRRELKRQQRTEQSQKLVQRKKLTIWLIIIVCAVAVGVITWALMAHRNTNTNNTSIAVDNPSLGSSTAKVVLDEYSDLSCPACAAVAPIIRQLATDYGDKLRIVFHPFSVGHQWSIKSMEAGYCAAEQNKVWEFSDLTFSKQADWETADNAVDIFKTYTSTIGLDTNTFNTCLDSGSMTAAVKNSSKEGQHQGVDSTPSFFINNKKVTIQNSFDELKTAIDAALATNT